MAVACRQPHSLREARKFPADRAENLGPILTDCGKGKRPALISILQRTFKIHRPCYFLRQLAFKTAGLLDGQVNGVLNDKWNQVHQRNFI